MKRLSVRPSGHGPRTPVVLAVPAVLAVVFLVLPLSLIHI